MEDPLGFYNTRLRNIGLDALPTLLQPDTRHVTILS